MTLTKELELHGVDMDAGRFEDLLQETRLCLFPAYILEDVLNRPIECGTAFVQAIRKATTKKALPEEFVMRRLQNIRKGGRMETSIAG